MSAYAKAVTALRNVIERWENADDTWSDDFARDLVYASEDLLRALGEES